MSDITPGIAPGEKAVRNKAVSDIAASDIVETVPSALIVLDKNLNITSAIEESLLA